MRTSPPVMSSRPTIMRRIVDFPHPDGPTRITNSPSAMSRLPSAPAGVVAPEKVLVRWSSRMLVMGHLSLWSSLHRPGGEARDDLTLENENQDHHRDGHDPRRRRDGGRGLLEERLAGEERQRCRDGAGPVGGRERDAEHEV